MTTHYLNIDPVWLSRILANQKHAEVRLDDRDYQTGDTIMFTHESGSWTYIERTITHVLRATGAGGLEDGYVVLSLADPRVAQLAEVQRENERLVRSNRSLRARARSLKVQR